MISAAGYGILANSGSGITTVPAVVNEGGDLVLVTVVIESSAITVTGLSFAAVPSFARIQGVTDATHGRRVELWAGKATSTSALANITATYSGSVTGVTIEITSMGMSAGFGPSTTWWTDLSNIALGATSTTITYPQLTPTWEDTLYYGASAPQNTPAGGSTPGYFYTDTISGITEVVFSTSAGVSNGGQTLKPEQPTSTQSSGWADSVAAIFTALPADMPLYRALVSFNDPQDSNATFFDLSRYLKTFRSTRGKQHEVDRFEAGTCDVLFDAVDGVLLPWNTAGPFYNMLSVDDASFEDSIGTWTATGGHCTAGHDTSHAALRGVGSLVLTCSSAGDLSAQTAHNAYPVSVGTTYTALASFKPLITSGMRSVKAYISWYDSGGTLLSTSTGSTATEVSGQWVQASVTATAPASAAWAQVGVTVVGATATLEEHQVDCAGLYQASTVPVWTPGAIANAGPFVPMCTVHITAEWAGTRYNRFFGYVDSWAPVWNGEVYADVEVKASDALKALNLFSISPQDYPTLVLADGPQAYWRLGDQNGATSASDSTNNNLGGTLSGTVAFTGAFTPLDAGGFGTGARLSDPSAGYAELLAVGDIQADAGTIAGAYNGTFECWVKLSADSTIWSIAAGNIIVKTVSGQVEVTTSGGANTGPAGPSVTDGAWHHVMVAAAAPGHGTTYIFVDGQQVASQLQAGGAYTLDNITFGGDLGGYKLHGSAQDLAIYGADVSARAAAHYAAGIAGWPQQNTEARVGAIVDLLGLPVSFIGGTGVVDIQARGQSPSPTSALSYINEAIDTEEGRFYAGPEGDLYFRERTFPTTNSRSLTSQVTFNDQGPLSGVEYEVGSPDLVVDDLDIWNEAVVTTNGMPTQTWTIAGSVRRFCSRVLQRSTFHVSVSDASAHADYLATKYGTPVPRVQSVVVSLASDGLGPNVIPYVLGSLFFDLVTVDRHMLLDGSVFSQEAFVEGIEDDYDSGSGAEPKWNVTLHLSAVA